MATKRRTRRSRRVAAAAKEEEDQEEEESNQDEEEQQEEEQEEETSKELSSTTRSSKRRGAVTQKAAAKKTTATTTATTKAEAAASSSKSRASSRKRKSAAAAAAKEETEEEEESDRDGDASDKEENAESSEEEELDEDDKKEDQKVPPKKKTRRSGSAAASASSAAEEEEKNEQMDDTKQEEDTPPPTLPQRKQRRKKRDRDESGTESVGGGGAATNSEAEKGGKLSADNEEEEEEEDEKDASDKEDGGDKIKGKSEGVAGDDDEAEEEEQSGAAKSDDEEEEEEEDDDDDTPISELKKKKARPTKRTRGSKAKKKKQPKKEDTDTDNDDKARSRSSSPVVEITGPKHKNAAAAASHSSRSNAKTSSDKGKNDSSSSTPLPSKRSTRQRRKSLKLAEADQDSLNDYVGSKAKSDNTPGPSTTKKRKTRGKSGRESSDHTKIASDKESGDESKEAEPEPKNKRRKKAGQSKEKTAPKSGKKSLTAKKEEVQEDEESDDDERKQSKNEEKADDDELSNKSKAEGESETGKSSRAKRAKKPPKKTTSKDDDDNETAAAADNSRGKKNVAAAPPPTRRTRRQIKKPSIYRDEEFEQQNKATDGDEAKLDSSSSDAADSTKDEPSTTAEKPKKKSKKAAKPASERKRSKSKKTQESSSEDGDHYDVERGSGTEENGREISRKKGQKQKLSRKIKESKPGASPGKSRKSSSPEKEADSVEFSLECTEDLDSDNEEDAEEASQDRSSSAEGSAEQERIPETEVAEPKLDTKGLGGAKGRTNDTVESTEEDSVESNENEPLPSRKDSKADEVVGKTKMKKKAESKKSSKQVKNISSEQEKEAESESSSKISTKSEDDVVEEKAQAQEKFTRSTGRSPLDLEKHSEKAEMDRDEKSADEHLSSHEEGGGADKVLEANVNPKKVDVFEQTQDDDKDDDNNQKAKAKSHRATELENPKDEASDPSQHIKQNEERKDAVAKLDAALVIGHVEERTQDISEHNLPQDTGDQPAVESWDETKTKGLNGGAPDRTKKQEEREGTGAKSVVVAESSLPNDQRGAFEGAGQKEASEDTKAEPGKSQSLNRDKADEANAEDVAEKKSASKQSKDEAATDVQIPTAKATAASPVPVVAEEEKGFLPKAIDAEVDVGKAKIDVGPLSREESSPEEAKYPAQPMKTDADHGSEANSKEPSFFVPKAGDPTKAAMPESKISEEENKFKKNAGVAHPRDDSATGKLPARGITPLGIEDMETTGDGKKHGSAATHNRTESIDVDGKHNADGLPSKSNKADVASDMPVARADTNSAGNTQLQGISSHADVEVVYEESPPRSDPLEINNLASVKIEEESIIETGQKSGINVEGQAKVEKFATILSEVEKDDKSITKDPGATLAEAVTRQPPPLTKNTNDEGTQSTIQTDDIAAELSEAPPYDLHRKNDEVLTQIGKTGSLDKEENLEERTADPETVGGNLTLTAESKHESSAEIKSETIEAARQTESTDRQKPEENLIISEIQQTVVTSAGPRENDPSKADNKRIDSVQEDQKSDVTRTTATENENRKTTGAASHLEETAQEKNDARDGASEVEDVSRSEKHKTVSPILGSAQDSAIATSNPDFSTDQQSKGDAGGPLAVDQKTAASHDVQREVVLPTLASGHTGEPKNDGGADSKPNEVKMSVEQLSNEDAGKQSVAHENDIPVKSDEEAGLKLIDLVKVDANQSSVEEVPGDKGCHIAGTDGSISRHNKQLDQNSFDQQNESDEVKVYDVSAFETFTEAPRDSAGSRSAEIVRESVTDMKQDSLGSSAAGLDQGKRTGSQVDEKQDSFDSHTDNPAAGFITDQGELSSDKKSPTGGDAERKRDEEKQIEESVPLVSTSAQTGLVFSKATSEEATIPTAGAPDTAEKLTKTGESALGMGTTSKGPAKSDAMLGKMTETRGETKAIRTHGPQKASTSLLQLESTPISEEPNHSTPIALSEEMSDTSARVAGDAKTIETKGTDALPDSENISKIDEAEKQPILSTEERVPAPTARISKESEGLIKRTVVEQTKNVSEPKENADESVLGMSAGTAVDQNETKNYSEQSTGPEDTTSLSKVLSPPGPTAALVNHDIPKTQESIDVPRAGEGTKDQGTKAESNEAGRKSPQNQNSDEHRMVASEPTLVFHSPTTTEVLVKGQNPERNESAEATHVAEPIHGPSEEPKGPAVAVANVAIVTSVADASNKDVQISKKLDGSQTAQSQVQVFQAAQTSGLSKDLSTTAATSAKLKEAVGKDLSSSTEKATPITTEGAQAEVGDFHTRHDTHETSSVSSTRSEGNKSRPSQPPSAHVAKESVASALTILAEPPSTTNASSYMVEIADKAESTTTASLDGQARMIPQDSSATEGDGKISIDPGVHGKVNMPGDTERTDRSVSHPVDVPSVLQQPAVSDPFANFDESTRNEFWKRSVYLEETPADPNRRDPKQKLENLKAKILKEARIVHGDGAAERLFVGYWKSLAKRLEGTESSKGSSSLIDIFLKTKKLRRLHNKFILGILKHCQASANHSEQTLQYIPFHMRKKVKMKEVESSTQFMTESAAYWLNPRMEEAHKSTRVRKADLIGTVAARTSAQKSDLRIPGALTIDPLVRNALAQSGMTASENAIWLVIVAAKEYANTTLKSCVELKKSIGQGKLARIPLPRPKILSLKNTTAAAPQKSSSSAGMRITALDVHTLISQLPMGDIESLGGTVSRCSHEENLMNFDLPTGRSEDALDRLRRFITQKIAPPIPVAAPTPATQSSKPLAQKPGTKSQAKKETTSQAKKESAAQAKKETALQAKKEAALQAKKESVGRLSPYGGMGRGAKDLAALRARATVPKTEDEHTPFTEKAPSGIPQASTATAKAEEKEVPNQPYGAETDEAGGRRGKGSGVKNLRAMIARSRHSPKHESPNQS